MARLTFDCSMAVSNLHPYTFVWENIEKRFFLTVLKTFLQKDLRLALGMKDLPTLCKC